MYEKYTLVNSEMIKRINCKKKLKFMQLTDKLRKKADTIGLMGGTAGTLDSYTKWFIENDNIIVASDKPFLLLESRENLSNTDYNILNNVFSNTKFDEIDLTNVTDCKHTHFEHMFYKCSADIIELGGLTAKGNIHSSFANTFAGCNAVITGLDRLDMEHIKNWHNTFYHAWLKGDEQYIIKLKNFKDANGIAFDTSAYNLKIRIGAGKHKGDMRSAFRGSEITHLYLELDEGAKVCLQGAFVGSRIPHITLIGFKDLAGFVNSHHYIIFKKNGHGIEIVDSPEYINTAPRRIQFDCSAQLIHDGYDMAKINELCYRLTDIGIHTGID